MKKGTVYPCEYINALYDAVSVLLTLPFDFICMTDDNKGLLSEIKTRPIPSGMMPQDTRTQNICSTLEVFDEELVRLQTQS